ncbi:SDR family NAD(P)-dependent oxidoreductase [Arthrobacter sp. MA-N2]|uniref:SDR family NAD(P)-dependent oxidoreductase n=1 Tax=Arthrobacter sp. MA-N2 TaxID=1101188 RepID=UPI0004B39262|nr:SDR family oxidoreductase [Arthrobacter sp. MA-N2]
MSALEAFALDGRVVIVTGASGGLGAEGAAALSDAGATVVITGRREQKLAEVADRIRAAGGCVHTRVLDMTDADAVRSAFAEIAETIGPFDALINNAAQAHQAGVLDVTDTDWARIIDINLTATFTAAQAFLRLRNTTRSTAIVNISSLAGVIGVRGQAAYVASKTGVVGLTKALAVEVARDNVRVNALAPGYFATDMPGEVLADEAATAVLLRKIPMRRLGEPAEIGPALVFLASDASRYMTGAVLNFDGGYTAQ